MYASIAMRVVSLVIFLNMVGCGKDPIGTCLDSWATRTTPAKCVSEDLCQAVTSDPTRVVSFNVDLQASSDTRGPDGTFATLPEPQRKEKWNCLSDALKARGVQKVEPYDAVLGDVNIEGTWNQVRDLLMYQNVLGISPGCTSPNVCTGCAQLSPQNCEQDAFCEAIHAAPFGPMNSCVLSSAVVGCRAPLGCDEAVSFAKDPQGKCWQFGGGCFPEGWTESRQSCSPDRGDLPACQ
jgi:hypothetical protein